MQFTYVTRLTIWGNPSKVTAELGLPPTHCDDEGEIPVGSTRKFRRDIWSYQRVQTKGDGCEGWVDAVQGFWAFLDPIMPKISNLINHKTATVVSNNLSEIVFELRILLAKNENPNPLPPDLPALIREN